MARTENRDRLAAYEERLRDEFGDEVATEIMKIFVQELGGFRITIPTLDDLSREEIHARIRAAFTGANYEELALRFGYRKRHIRRIVSE